MVSDYDRLAMDCMLAARIRLFELQTRFPCKVGQSHLIFKGCSDVIEFRYQGDMTRAQRDAAVRAFMKDNEVSVMLMSLKCGGVGLVSNHRFRALLRSDSNMLFIELDARKSSVQICNSFE